MEVIGLYTTEGQWRILYGSTPTDPPLTIQHEMLALNYQRALTNQDSLFTKLDSNGVISETANHNLCVIFWTMMLSLLTILQKRCLTLIAVI